MTKLQFNLFTMMKVPLARIAGVKLESVDDLGSRISLRYRWLNTNPFKSMFWAAEGMAAEFSTGILPLMKIAKSGQKVAMLVVGMEAEFQKKAVGKIVFVCGQGSEVDAALAQTIATKEPVTLTMRSVGTDEQGDVVAEFAFVWSFRAK